MELQPVSLRLLEKHTVGILGYGNQGRAHALNLRDAGAKVVIGARPGAGEALARQDGFAVEDFQGASEQSSVLMFLLPDPVIPEIYAQCFDVLREGKTIGFAHGYAYHFKQIDRIPNCHYMLVAPKGAGAILRERFEDGRGLPVAFAAESTTALDSTRALAREYAEVIGRNAAVVETSFKEECECDLFGEQTVLCGGLMELMESAHNTLVNAGYSDEMAFYESCYEVQRILDVLLKYGPYETTKRISPTAFYGGLTRGTRVITSDLSARMEEILEEIRSGDFSREWEEEVREGMPKLDSRREQLRTSRWQKAFEKLRDRGGLDA